MSLAVFLLGIRCSHYGDSTTFSKNIRACEKIIAAREKMRSFLL